MYFPAVANGKKTDGLVDVKFDCIMVWNLLFVPNGKKTRWIMNFGEVQTNISSDLTENLFVS